MDIFKKFNEGVLVLPHSTKNFLEVEWIKHPDFQGVELKHIVTSRETGGKFSYHLVRIAPGCSIESHIHKTQLETHEVIKGSGECINDGVTLSYQPGTISIMPAGVEHKVNAGDQGLFLFAKFIPPLC